MKLLITGGTGFIGKTFLLKSYNDFEKIYLLVRPHSLKKAFTYFKDIPNIEFVVGNILDNDVCESIKDLERICEEVDSIFHLAAIYDLDMSLVDAYTHNVIGVQNVLNLARKIKNLKFFHHVSTYAVNGNPKNRVYENDLNERASFSDHYSRSKMQGEHLVRTMNIGKSQKRIYRPGIVVGSYETGLIQKIDGPYYFYNLVLKLKEFFPVIEKLGFFPFPYDESTSFPIIPVDTLTDWFANSIAHPKNDEEIRTYHFISDRNIDLKNFLETSLKELGLNIPVLQLNRSRFYKFILPRLGIPSGIVGYLYSGAQYDITQRKKDFPELVEVEYQDYASTLVKGFEKYIQEQIQ